MSVLSKVLLVSMMILPVGILAQDANEEWFAAARKGDIAAVKAMLDKGADVNAKTRYGATALSYACDRENVELVKLLIDRGADVNAKDTFYGEVPLGWALSKGNAQIVKLLLDKGATGLDRALGDGIQSGNLEIVKVVLEKGGLKQETLNKALIRASAGSNKEIIEVLKKAGAVVSTVTVEQEVLKTYAGSYKNDQVGELTIDVKDGKLAGKVAGQGWFSTYAVNKNTFALVEVEATMTFNTEGDKISGLTLKQSGMTFVFKRQEQK